MLPETIDACEADDQLCEYVLDTTGNEWIAGAANWLIAKPAVILLIIVVGLLARWLLFRIIDRIAQRVAIGLPTNLTAGRLSKPEEQTSTSGRVAHARRQQRADTLATVLKSITSFAIFTIVGIMVLAELNVNVGPLVAGAGIVGVALGFGAQSLVRDFLSGIFMFFEDQYGVGDVIDAGEASGVVEAVTLRVTRLRDVNGTVWYVRNGEILRIGNMSQNWARTVLDVSVGYGEDLARVREVLREVAHELYEDPEFHSLVMEEPEVWGVERMEADGVAVRVAIKTAPLEQWKVARELRERIKNRFDADGIEIPFPQRVVWTRSEQKEPASTG